VNALVAEDLRRHGYSLASRRIGARLLLIEREMLPFASLVLDGAQFVTRGQKLAPETTSRWHYDDTYADGKQPHRGPLRAGDRALVTMLCASCDFTERNGATELVPGSHLQHYYYDEPDAFTRLLLKRHEIVIFVGSHVLHRPGRNTSGVPRLATILRFEGRWRS